MTGRGWPNPVALVAIAFFAAMAGVVLGRFAFSPPVRPASLQKVLDSGLALDPKQRAAVAAIRAAYAPRHRALHEEMRRDNLLIARALESEPAFGSRTAAAVDRSHVAMGRMQKLVIEETFRIRAVLRPDQAATYNRAVVEALTDAPR